jgi:predicted nucleotidyltransferase
MDLNDPISAVIPSIDGRVLQVLARAGLPMTGHGIADAAGASPEGARRVLMRLRENGLVTVRPAGSALLYQANRRHLLWPAVQRLMVEADQVVSAVKRRISGVIDAEVGMPRSEHVTAALFGSVARGESRRESDIDVLLITPEGLELDAVTSLLDAVADDVQHATGNDCHVYSTDRARFDEMVASDDPMVASWAADAQVFHGPDFRRRLSGGPWDER